MLWRVVAYLVSLLGVLLLYIAYEGWLAWLVLASLLALPIFSLIISLPAILTMRLTVDNRGTAPVGMPLALEITVKCLLPAPMYRCSIQVRRPMTGETWLLKPGQMLPTEHCGLLVLQPVRCWVSDYFGLFLFPIHKRTESVLTLWPQELKMPESKDLERFMMLSWRPKPGGGYGENHEMRLYQPGDSLNQVHWKLTAKTGKLMVRQAMEPARGRAVLTADLKGTDTELDRVLGRILYRGRYLVENGLHFDLHVLTGQGRLHWCIGSEAQLHEAVFTLLQTEVATEGTLAGLPVFATWRCHLGGEPDEA